QRATFGVAQIYLRPPAQVSISDMALPWEVGRWRTGLENLALPKRQLPCRMIAVLMATFMQGKKYMDLCSVRETRRKLRICFPPATPFISFTRPMENCKRTANCRIKFAMTTSRQ